MVPAKLKSVQCDVCKLIVKFVDQYVENNKTEVQCVCVCVCVCVLCCANIIYISWIPRLKHRRLWRVSVVYLVP